MGYRKFRAFFGTSPQVCEIVWDRLSTLRPKDSIPEHLLWGLMLLKQYNIETVNATLVGVTNKTFRKWSMIFIRLLANLSVVNKSNSSEIFLIKKLTDRYFIFISISSLIGSNDSKTLQETHPLSFL